MFQYLVIVGVVVQTLGYTSYIKETLRGNTKPNRVTWLLWAIAPLIAAVAAAAEGVTWAALPVFITGFGSLIIFIASFLNKKAYWKLTTFDYLCGFLSILALILWYITSQPVIAIIFAIISDAMAALPTLSKSWKSPRTETIAPYAASLFGALTSFTAIKTMGFAEYAFPAWMIIINLCIVGIIWKKKPPLP